MLEPHIETMSDNLTVRFVAKSDFDRWLPLWDGYNAFYRRSGRLRARSPK